MKKDQAEQVRSEILELCKKNKLWWDVQEKGQPKLKDIIITVSIRIKE